MEQVMIDQVVKGNSHKCNRCLSDVIKKEYDIPCAIEVQQKLDYLLYTRKALDKEIKETRKKLKLYNCCSDDKTIEKSVNKIPKQSSSRRETQRQAAKKFYLKNREEINEKRRAYPTIRYNAMKEEEKKLPFVKEVDFEEDEFDVVEMDN